MQNLMAYWTTLLKNMSGDSLDEEWKKLKKKGINQKGSTKDVSFKADSKKKVNVFDEDITLLLHKFHSEWREDLQKEQVSCDLLEIFLSSPKYSMH